MNKVLVFPDFLKVLFFSLVGLGYAISSLAWPRRRASFACFGDTLLEISSFALKKTEPATQATLETAQLNRELLKGQLGASLLFRKLRIGHTRVLG